MMRNPCLMVIALGLSTAPLGWASVEHGRTTFTELSASNATGQTSHLLDGGSANFDLHDSDPTFGVHAGNLGDVLVTFTDSASLATEFADGVAVSSPLNADFDNPHTSDGHATTAVEKWDASGGYLISMFHAPSGVETNVDTGMGYFPYSEGWLGGVFRNTTNNIPLSDGVSSFAPGVSFADGTVQRLGVGLTTVDLRTLTSGGLTAYSTNGIFLVSGGRNEDNVASYSSNPDGTFTVYNRDNSLAGGTEDDGIAFVFIPKGSIATGMVDGLLPFGRFDADGSQILGQGEIAALRDGANDRWTITVTGQTPNSGTLLVAMDEAGSTAAGNFITARPNGTDWIVEHWDVDGGPGVESGLAGPAFSAVFLPDAGSITVGSAEAVPTLTEWGMIALILGLAFLAASRVVFLRPVG